MKDSTGGVVPGATVTVVNKATNATRTTQSNEVGLFDFPALPPGNYTVQSELEGFKTASRELELQVQQTARVNFTLELGTISRNGDRHRRLAAGRNRERDHRHRHREPAHRRAAAERQKLSLSWSR